MDKKGDSGRMQSNYQEGPGTQPIAAKPRGKSALKIIFCPCNFEPDKRSA